jgi:hypothetical protein
MELKKLVGEPFGDEHMRALGLGFSGCHRSGKTTIAKRIAEKNNCPFIETSMSALANEMGVKIGLDMPFDQRQEYQEAALAKYLSMYEEFGSGGLFTTDRTPIDLAAYVVTAWHPAVVDEAQTFWADDYVERCLKATNEWLFQIAVIQPGIAWVDADQKAENINFYRESLNTTCIGLAWDDRVTSACHIVNRNVLDLDERVSSVVAAYSENIGDYVRNLKLTCPVQ